MSTTREALPRVTLDSTPPQALYAKLSPGPGRSAREVALHQRVRLYGAMIEIVGERGYDTVTVRELTRLAGVSTRAFYEHFQGKEDCFLQTYEWVVQCTAGKIASAQKGEGGSAERLRLGFRAFARELERRPHKARLALVEAPAVGPAALERVRCAEDMFEGMVADGFASAPDRLEMPPLLVRGIVSGVASVVRTRLLTGREGELPGLADELAEWVLSYRRESTAELERLDVGSVQLAVGKFDRNGNSGDPDPHRPGDERALILAAVAKLAATGDHQAITAPRIRAVAGVSSRSFNANFESVENCVIEALGLRIDQAFSQASQAYAEGRDWADGVHCGLVSLCECIASDPLLTRLEAFEALSLEPAGTQRRELLLASFASSLRNSAPAERRPSELVAEASVGAIWGVVHRQIVSGQARELADIAPALSFMALAPVVGFRAAVTAVT